MKLDMFGSAGLVTGAAGSIGRAVSAALVEAGAELLVTDRDSKVKVAAAELGAEVFVGDLSDPDGAEAAVRRTVEAFGRIDFLANVAGVQARGPLLELDDSRWDLLYSVNLESVFKTCRAAAREMVSRGGGVILNVSSNASITGQPGIVAYGAMKAGVVQLSRGMAVELAAEGVRVNALAPGWVRTPMTADLFADDERRGRVISKIPMGRIAEPEELAPAALFLLSPASSFVTGEVLYVDGGYAAQ